MILAYYSVLHDAPSHLAMTTHRNWAITTLIVILCITVWSYWQYRNKKTPTLLFLAGMVLTFGLLMSTAWHGSEVVYRYGIGVLSLPKVTEVGHKHNHNDEKTIRLDEENHQQNHTH